MDVMNDRLLNPKTIGIAFFFLFRLRSYGIILEQDTKLFDLDTALFWIEGNLFEELCHEHHSDVEAANLKRDGLAISTIVIS